MNVQICNDLDQSTGVCNSALVWVTAEEFHQAGDSVWLDVSGALTIVAAIGLLWASAWVLRAIAHQIRSYI